MALEQGRVRGSTDVMFVAMVAVDDIVIDAWLGANEQAPHVAIQYRLDQLKDPKGIDFATSETTRLMADMTDPRFQRKFRPGSVPDIDPQLVLPYMISGVERFLTMNRVDQLDFTARAQQAKDTGLWD